MTDFTIVTLFKTPNSNLKEEPMADKKIPSTEAEFQEFMLQVVRTLLATLEEKDPILKKHSERVANNCANFCEKYKIFRNSCTIIVQRLAYK